jgi:hypothetical protein
MKSIEETLQLMTVIICSLGESPPKTASGVYVCCVLLCMLKVVKGGHRLPEVVKMVQAMFRVLEVLVREGSASSVLAVEAGDV